MCLCCINFWVYIAGDDIKTKKKNYIKEISRHDFENIEMQLDEIEYINDINRGKTIFLRVLTFGTKCCILLITQTILTGVFGSVISGFRNG